MKEKKVPIPRRARPHGSGSLTSLAEGKWRIGYDTAGPGQPRRQRFEVCTGTKKKAEALLGERLATARRGGFASGDSVTFGELAERFVAEKRFERRQETTALLYERLLRCHVTPVIGNLKVRSITSEHVVALLQGARDVSRQGVGQPLGWRVLDALQTLISSILEYGVRHDVLVKNVCKLVPRPAKPHVERKAITVEQARAYILAAVGTPLEGLVAVAIGSGLRRQELCGLRVSDVDFETGRYHVRRAVKNLPGRLLVGKPKTAKSARNDTLPAFALGPLLAHRARQLERFVRLGIRPEDPYVFDNGVGGVLDPNKVTTAWLRLVRSKVLPPCRFHDLRHTNASLLFAAGVPLQTISESLGHSNIAITSAVYTHLMEGAMDEKSAALDDLMTGATGKAKKGA